MALSGAGGSSAAVCGLLPHTHVNAVSCGAPDAVGRGPAARDLWEGDVEGHHRRARGQHLPVLGAVHVQSRAHVLLRNAAAACTRHGLVCSLHEGHAKLHHQLRRRVPEEALAGSVRT